MNQFAQESSVKGFAKLHMTYCPLSGLSTRIEFELEGPYMSGGYDGPQVTPGSLVWDALTMIATYVDRDIILHTLIDVFNEDGTPLEQNGSMSHDEISQILDSQIRVVSSNIDYVDPGGELAQSIDQTGMTEYDIVNPHTRILVANESLAILSLATGGRMTLGRVWRVVIANGWEIAQGQQGNYRRGLSNIEYYEDIPECRLEFPELMPGFSTNTHTAIEEINKLESLGDAELIRHAIVWEGKFWVWMGPDWFPPGETPDDHLTVPIVLESPASLHALSRMEQLPIEILTHIASYCCPLSSLLCLLSTSCYIRSKFLAHSSDRDALARAWIQRSAAWYIPVNQSNDGKIKRERISWAYLVRCVESPSMRNRKRIWGIAEQLERKADAMGI